ncbi:hypothetical protein B0H13DRAFT_2077818 [Mycena leptocephala]|nr:hypothetical protein B0H13DRAFT_2077818 [Mycena leptocephala]
MGAKIAQGLVLIGPAPMGKLEIPAEMREQQITAYSSRESAELALKYVLLGSDVGADELCLLVNDCVGGSEHARIAWPKYGTQENYENLAAGTVEGLNIPVVVVVGGLDKIETAERVEEKVIQVLKKAGASVTMTVLEGVGHLMPVEAPKQLDEVIRTFAQ